MNQVQIVLYKIARPAHISVLYAFRTPLLCLLLYEVIY